MQPPCVSTTFPSSAPNALEPPTRENIILSATSLPVPDAAYWPSDRDTVEVVCPWCGAKTTSFIGIVKEMNTPGRDDDCQSCERVIIVEAFADGIVAVQAECKPLWP